MKILNWIKNLFKKESPKAEAPSKPNLPEIPDSSNSSTTSNSSKPIESDLGPSVASRKIKKIAIIIGHGHGDTGAPSKWNSPIKVEYDYNKIVAEHLKKTVKSKEIRLFYRGATGITGVNTQVRLWDDDLSLELHCNSFNGKAHGCEILALSGDKESIKIGQDIAQDFCKRFNRKLRDGDGVKELKKKERGHYSLALVDDGYPSILLEPFFIDNPSEWIDPIVYAEFLREWIEII